MRLFVTCTLWLLLANSANAFTVTEQVKMLQRAEKQASSAMISGDVAALRHLNKDFSSQLQSLLASDAPFECKMAGNAMQGLLISVLLPPSARKLTAIDHDAGQWEKNMDACERDLRLPSKRLITR